MSSRSTQYDDETIVVVADDYITEFTCAGRVVCWISFDDVASSEILDDRTGTGQQQFSTCTWLITANKSDSKSIVTSITLHCKKYVYVSAKLLVTHYIIVIIAACEKHFSIKNRSLASKSQDAIPLLIFVLRKKFMNLLPAKLFAILGVAFGCLAVRNVLVLSRNKLFHWHHRRLRQKLRWFRWTAKQPATLSCENY